MKILLIEDNSDHALFTQRVLKKMDEGCQLVIVDEGREGIKKAGEESYDLIISDYRLPDLTALDILRSIRGNGPELPFIVVTSVGSEKVAVELMKEGAYDYVVKDSFYQDSLPIVIQRALERHKVKKEKEKLEKELKDSNEKLKKMYDIKSDFTSMVSHELRTPLTAIKEGISIVLDGSAGQVNARQGEFLGLAKRNVDRLKRLIDDVLDFTKLESRKMDFKMRLGDINGLTAEAVDSQKGVAREKGLYLDVELAPDMPKIIIDSDKITQVFTNVISNAIKFTEKGGITVSTIIDEKQNVIISSVRDTGEGIKQDDLPKLFKKFQQLGGANNRKTGGTGLGLAICKEIIERHGGRIWFESEYGKGSECKFTLPIKRQYKVLIIDDEEVALEIGERFLKNSGYLVTRSNSGMEGISLAQADIPDSIVLDMRLKDISGYEVIGRLRSNNDTAGIPILAVSGFMDEIDKIKVQKEELALPWILKPFSNEEFISKVEALVRK